MKVLAFAASTSSQSINKQLVTHAAEQLRQNTPNTEVEIIDLNDFEMPIYSSDRENDHGIPEQAHAFLKKIAEADALLISFAEHNGSYTAAFKNTFDWASRAEMKVYQGKPAVLLATSPGPGGAKNVLNSALGSAPHFAMEVKGSLSVPSFFDNFDAEAQVIKDEELSAQLMLALAELEQA